MKAPTTYEVNTPRLIVKYLTKLVGEVNDNSAVLSDLKDKREKEQLRVEAKKRTALEAKSKAEAKALTKANALAAAKRIIAEAEAKVKAKEQAKLQAKLEEENLRKARKLLGIE